MSDNNPAGVAAAAVPADEPLLYVDPVDLVEGGVPDGRDPDDTGIVTGDDPDFDQGGVA